MVSAFNGAQDREEVATMNAQDAEEVVCQDEDRKQEDAHVELQSIFEDDLEDELEGVDDNGAAPSATVSSQNADASLGTQDDNNDDSTWLRTREDKDNKDRLNDSSLGATAEGPPKKRPSYLMTDSASRKRIRVSNSPGEPKLDPEDQHSPKVSPRTRKRFRTEREHGYPYENRPRSSFRGTQLDEYDTVGTLFPSLVCHYSDTLSKYYGRDKRTKGATGKPTGKTLLPEFPYLPTRLSPLGQDAHRDGKWNGLLTIPASPQPPYAEEKQEEEEKHEESPLSPVESEHGDIFKDNDENDDENDANPPRPSTPAPDYDNDEDLVDSQNRDSTSFSEDYDSNTSQSSETNEDDEASTGASGDEALTSDVAYTEDTGVQQLEERQDESEDPATFPSSSLSSTSNLNNDEKSSPLHPSSREKGREVGQLSKPWPRDPEIAQLKLRNAKLALELSKCHEEIQRSKQEADKEIDQLNARIEGLQEFSRDLEDKYYESQGQLQSLGDGYNKQRTEYHELEGEYLASRQRAEYKAEQLVKQREDEDAKRLTLITNLKTKYRAMKIWAEGLDAAAEPARLANDDLTAKLEAAEKDNTVLKQELDKANATVQEVSTRSLRIAQAYNALKSAGTTTAATPQLASTPPAAPAELPIAATTPLFTPVTGSVPFSLPTRFDIQETHKVREARWRILGARQTTRNAQRMAKKKEADDEYEADRALRLEAFRAATGRAYVEIEAGQRRRDLMQIVNARNSVVTIRSG